ncbi:MAG: hypothetical protein HGN29_01075 [Asgard group archaeon]|nr:hypothetical protein [Asgard group archaeon]
MVILIGLTTTIIGWENVSELTFPIGAIQPSSKTSSTHVPINILSDQNFTDYGFPGTGTRTNPYRIENYSINTTEEKAINIQNVSKSFIIQHCFVTAERYGIYVENAVGDTTIIRDNECTKCWDGISITLGGSVAIINNTCYQNENYGIRAYDIYDYVLVVENNCSYNGRGLVAHKIRDAKVYDNLCTFNIFEGVIIWETVAIVYQNVCDFNNDGITTRITPPALIYNNTCKNNTESGIRLFGASDSIVTNNTCVNNRNGIYNINSFHTKIINNACFKNEYGLFFDIGSWYCTVSENDCFNNTQAGIALAPSRFSKISNNTIHYNQGFGIYSERSLECIITYNLIENNDDYGVYLENTTNKTQIAYNYLLNNNPSGTSQGYDAGKNNNWFDEENKAGNFWSDWKGRGKYKIAGPAESVDKYPLNEQLERVSSLSFLWLSLSFFLLTLPIFSKKLIKNN